MYFYFMYNMAKAHIHVASNSNQKADLLIILYDTTHQKQLPDTERKRCGLSQFNPEAFIESAWMCLLYSV